jgi:hypothetical protein
VQCLWHAQASSPRRRTTIAGTMATGYLLAWVAGGKRPTTPPLPPPTRGMAMGTKTKTTAGPDHPPPWRCRHITRPCHHHRPPVCPCPHCPHSPLHITVIVAPCTASSSYLLLLSPLLSLHCHLNHPRLRCRIPRPCPCHNQQ